MHTSAKILLPLALFLFHHAQAIPVAQGGAIATPAGSTYCPETDSYTVSEETQISGEPQLVGSSCTPNTDGDEGCGGERSASYEVSTTVTVGGSLSLDRIVGVGLEASVSTTTAKGTVDTSTVECKGPWTCSILLTPVLVRVRGEKTTSSCRPDDSPSTSPYEVTFPKLNDAKNPVKNTKSCACPDFEAWADEGAPETCPGPCGGK